MSFDVVLTVVAGTLVVLGLTAGLAKQYTLSPFLLAVGAGAVLGPQVLGLADPPAGAAGRTTLLQSLAVLVSMVVHTLTATPSLHWYARRTGSEVPAGRSPPSPGRCREPVICPHRTPVVGLASRRRRRHGLISCRPPTMVLVAATAGT